MQYSVKLSHLTDPQLRYTLVITTSCFQTQQVLCLLCMTEGENPNMIHYFPFWTCTFKHFQQPVQEATKKLMRSLHMAFGCCSYCKPTSRTARCISAVSDICLLGGQSTPAAPTPREPVVSVVARDKGLTWALFMQLSDRLCHTAWLRAPSSALSIILNAAGHKRSIFPKSCYHF